MTSVLSSSLVTEDTEALLVREEIRRTPTRSLGIPVFSASQPALHHDACGFFARTKALMNLPSTRGAIAATSIPLLDSNSRASSTR